MRIEYRYHSGDIDEAFRAVRSRAWKKARTRLLILIPLVIATTIVLVRLDPGGSFLPFVLGVCIGAWAFTFASWQRAKNMKKDIWKSYPMIQYKFTAEIDQDSIKTACDIASSTRRWECFTGYFESANLFHIQEGARFLWIPKRAFTSEAEMNEMRELLRSKLSLTA